ncbi:MAG: anhydro-N-acetylmuramic acid kinase, partial [Spirulinaceae cyanobacterium]
MKTKVIGLISGTSVDGIDAALVEISGLDLDLEVNLLAGETYPYPASLREQILAVCAGEKLSVEELAKLDDEIATQFAQAAQKIQGKSKTADLIGSHGQTIFHRPPNREQAILGYSLQIGRGSVIANFTGIPTVSNFRVADIAAGGEGAPLVSKVDACLLSHQAQYRCVQNLGGIGNVTYLPARQEANWLEQVCGWDTGPGNA